ncbi:hypothetical protein KAU15_06275, partial [candidate division WOR-3 bacterium]|nr:hypothetical protein [candidate division WOR-3 bacterium]
VNFTFPSDLTDDVTYFWKVKASDPLGSGYWGGYTVFRTFTVFTPLGANNCSWYQNKNNQMQQNNYYTTLLEDDSIRLIPSGGTALDTLFYEDFESGVMPAGWSVVNGDGDAYTWYINGSGQSDLGGYEPPNAGSYYAYYSDDDAGSINNTAEEYLYSPIYPIIDRDSLFASYDYGFRQYGSSELTAQYRYYKTGSWTVWFDIASYTTHGFDTGNVNITSLLPFDSLQLRWIYEDNGAWGYATAIDNATVYGKTIIVNDDGYFTTPPVYYNDLNNIYSRTDWGNITWRQSSDADSISVQVLYHNGANWALIPNTDLPDNDVGFYGSSINSFADISGLNTSIYDSIKAQFNFYRKASKSSIEPTIIAIEIGNLNENINFVEISKPIQKNVFYPKVFALMPVSPTLIRSDAYISYQIPMKSDVNISIHDILGREVNVIVDGKKSPGFYKIRWNGNDKYGKKLSAGTYFIKMKAGDYT